MKKPVELSIVIPAYKQGKTIKANLAKVEQVVSKITKNYEIICVVDGVVDDTFEKAKNYKSNKIKVVGYKYNRGKGSAVRFGMQLASGALIAMLDADDNLNQEGLRLMLEHFKWYNADIVVGSKRHPASKVKYPWQRRILSFGYQILVKVMFGLNIRDTQVGMKIFKKQVIDEVLPRLLVKQFAFDIEILSVANYLGFKRIYEAPVEVRLDFNKSSGIVSKGFLKTILNMLKDTLAVFYRLKILKYYRNSNMTNWYSEVYPDVI